MPTLTSPIKRWWLVVNLVVLLLSANFQLSLVYSITPLEQAQADYSFQLTKYAESRDRYLTAKANYMAFKTAVAKNDAFAKTKDYFIQVHNVYIAYLLLINERTNVFDWSFSDYKKDEYAKLIRTESDYIKQSQQKAQNVQTLEEITPLAATLKAHVKDTTLPTVGNVLATADLAQIQDTFYSFKLASQNIDKFVQNKINDSNQPLYLNWKSEIEAINIKVDKQIQASKTTVDQTRSRRTFDPQNTQIYEETQESRKELERAKGLLAEILDFI